MGTFVANALMHEFYIITLRATGALCVRNNFKLNSTIFGQLFNSLKFKNDDAQAYFISNVSVTDM